MRSLPRPHHSFLSARSPPRRSSHFLFTLSQAHRLQLAGSPSHSRHGRARDVLRRVPRSLCPFRLIPTLPRFVRSSSSFRSCRCCHFSFAPSITRSLPFSSMRMEILFRLVPNWRSGSISHTTVTLSLDVSATLSRTPPKPPKFPSTNTPFTESFPHEIF